MNIFLILVFSFGIWAKAPSADLIQRILLPIKTCPEKIWPGYNPLKDAEFVINVPSENKSILIKEDGSIEERTSAEWGDEGRSSYSYGEKEGRNFVIVNFEDSEDEEQTITTLFHEGFHFLGQKGMDPSTGRDELFPLDYEARVARAMQLKNMRAYLTHKNTDNLQKASFWEKWIQTNRPEEHKSNQDWDVIEGSAEFVGLISSAVTILGCEASEEDLMKKVLELSETSNDIYDRSGQSYNAGLMGYMVSRINNVNKVFSELNRSPLSTALADCQEIEEAPDQSIQEEMAKTFGPIEKAVSNADSELQASSGLVAIPREALVGAFSTMGFFTTLVDGQRVMVLPSTTLQFSLWNKSFSVSNRNFWDSSLRKQICGSDGEFLLIPKESIPEITNFHEDGLYLGKKLYCPRLAD